MAILEVRGLTKYFGGLAAVNGLDFDVNEGEIVGLIGPNGAGKTTVLNLLTGFHHLTRGEIIFKGRKLGHLKPNEIAARGIVRNFQSNVSFESLTVLENVLVAHHLQRRISPFFSWLNIPIVRREGDKILQHSMEILEGVKLTEMKNEFPVNLPHGHRRALGISIAMAAKPALMLLDEPVTGMIAEETKFMMSCIRRMRDEGITILLVEHNMNVVMNICDRLVVLNFGKKIAEGLPEEIKNNKDVIDSYLGSQKVK